MAFGLVEQPASGSRNGNGSYEFIFKCAKGDGEAHFSEFAAMAESGGKYRGLYIDIEASRMSTDTGYDTLFIVGTKSPKAETYTDIDRADGETTYSLSLNHMERTIELLPEYRTHMNHDLWTAVEATEENLKNPAMPSIPAWWAGAKDTNIPLSDQFLFCWGQSRPADQTVKSGGINKVYRWLLLTPRTLPGREVKPVACPMVIERIYFRSESKAAAALKKANTLQAPKRTYIYGKNDKNWLFQPQGIDESNGYFVCVNHYIYADKWDEVFYQ